MSQAENNKLIAEFMEFPTHTDAVDDRTIAYDIGGSIMNVDNTHNENDDNVFHPDDMQFHTSWDWLMPVLQKCRKKNQLEYFDVVYYALEECDINITYKAVVEFINQYNKSKEEKWYEVAVSYIHDNGTETIERKPSLVEAIDFAQKFKPELDVDFVFIDRWFCDYEGNNSGKDDEFKTLIINRK